MRVLLRVCESACLLNTKDRNSSAKYEFQTEPHSRHVSCKKEKENLGASLGVDELEEFGQKQTYGSDAGTESRNVPPDAHCTPPASYPLHVHSSALLRGPERVKTHHARTNKKKNHLPPASIPTILQTLAPV